MIQFRSMTTAFSSPCSSDLQQLMSYNEKDAYLVTTPIGGDSSPSSTRSSSLSPRAPEEDLEAVEVPMIRDEAQSQQQQQHQQQQQQVKQWSYEEQFRQLYNLSPEPERKEFLDKLFDYMQKKGTPITRIPIMAKQPLDMFKLYKLVVERGGLVEVIKKKAWRDIAKELNLPASITSAAFTMRSQYVKYIYPYECEMEHLSDPKELQVAVESNKRDRRHSDNPDFAQASQEAGERRNVIPHTAAYTVTGIPSGMHLPGVALPQTPTVPYSGGGLFVTPGGTAVLAPRFSVTGGASPQLVQMAATTNPHLQSIVVPANMQQQGGAIPSLATIIPVKHDQHSPTIMNISEKSEDEHDDFEQLTPHQYAGLKHSRLPIIVPTTLQGPGVFQIKNGPEELVQVGGIDKRREEVGSERLEHDEEPPPAKRPQTEPANVESPQPSASSLRMPFTNISIKPVGTSNLEGSSSVLVTLELNNSTYQGVLFARPQSSGLTSPR